MYRIVSNSRLPLTLTITSNNGLELVKTLPRFGETLSGSITKSIQVLNEKGLVIVSKNSTGQHTSSKSAKSKSETGSVSESVNIKRYDQPVMGVANAQFELSANDILDKLNQKDLDELKSIANQLKVSYGANIGKDTLAYRLSTAEGIINFVS